MDTFDGSGQQREEVARLLVERLRQRAVLNEAVGILQVWRGCDQQQARDDMHTDHGTTGQHAEARRMIAVVNAEANGRTDPDVRWE
jgi:hypothetical protein